MTSYRYPWAEAGQMTLGALADALAALPPSLMIPALCAPHSYRGAYSHIAFEQGAPSMARDVAALVRAQIGRSFQSWKSGEFEMAGDTPVHIASWGREGRAIIGLDAEGRVILKPEEPDGAGWDDDLPDTSGITADAIRRAATLLTPADADKVKWRELAAISPDQAAALCRAHGIEPHDIEAHLVQILWLTVSGFRGALARMEPCKGSGHRLEARCTHTQALRAREVLDFIIGRAEVDYT